MKKLLLPLLSILLFTACKKEISTTKVQEEVAGTAANRPQGKFRIGDPYQGGIFAYILRKGDPGYIAGQTHGLIAAASDQSTGAEWGCAGTGIPGADGTALGTGNQNTIDIMTGCATAGIALRLFSVFAPSYKY